MKTALALILLFVASLGYAQKTDYASIRETPEAYIIEVVSSSDLDSGETYISKAFDASAIIAWYLQGNLADYKERDTTVNNYKHSNVLYPTVIYNGSGTDSVGVPKLQGKGLDGTWTTFDSLQTAGATPCSLSPLYFYNGVPLYSEWRITFTVADITVSSYDATFYFELIVPKRRKI